MSTYIFDTEKLQQMILDFYTCTNIAITLYDQDGTVIVQSGIHNPYCAALRKSPQCLAACDMSNLFSIESVRKTRETVYYTCHGGNREMITPIFYEHTIIAYLQIGQFHNTQHPTLNVEKITQLAQQCLIPPQRLQQLYYQVPVISEEKLTALKHILDILIRSFWEDGLIRCRRSMLSVQIEQYLITHLSESLTVDMICSTFSISKNALYRLFREEFNTTVGAFLLEKRIMQAKVLLHDAQYSIGDVAEQCGFSDYNYFIRVFRKSTGITPLRYRKSSHV